jgi:hypothetical protein
MGKMGFFVLSAFGDPGMRRGREKKEERKKKAGDGGCGRRIR